MSKISLAVLTLILVCSIVQLYSQPIDGGYDDDIYENQEQASSGSGTRIPIIYIAVAIVVFSFVMYYHILNKRFIEYLDQRRSPQSSAASCLILWLSWVFVVVLIFIGFDVINMDFLNPGAHLSSALVRIVIIIGLYALLYLAISPYKKKEVK